jgi:hypothetical protein
MGQNLSTRTFIFSAALGFPTSLTGIRLGGRIEGSNCRSSVRLWTPDLNISSFTISFRRFVSW